MLDFTEPVGNWDFCLEVLGAKPPARSTVFGKVVTGMRVVDYIASTPTGDAIATLEKGQAPLRNVPLEPIIIERISLVNP